MSDTITAQEIILSLNPEYSRCKGCKRLMHTENNKLFHRKLLKTASLSFNFNQLEHCTFCESCHAFMNHLIQETKSEIKEAEHIFGDVYDIVYNWDQQKFIITKKKTEE